ncbi:hypothetical protein CBS63078_11076 [Aspergillus niger]|nr:hypothetical protein CBS63078_11076 [Aspergillus niger]KAI3015359.1 hypothetical protein CBS147347_11223 [Aspergillus niger]KAI3032424.1 hypothetical protein CBS76997_11385 [Aspergillus niger]
MEETIAELRRQIEEQQRLREAAERREEERQAREDAERRVQPNTLFRLLDRCHNSLSQAIRVEADATLTTQGDAADPVNRLYPKHIVPWRDFPQLQEQIWDKFDQQAALFRASFPNHERDTVDNLVEKIINALRDDELLRHEFGIQGRVTFYDRANLLETGVQSAAQRDDPRIGGEYLDVLRHISENFRQDPRASVSTRAQLHPSTRPLKAVSVIKTRIRYLLLPHPRRATDRAAASATTARQPWEAKGYEPAETIKRLLGKTDILRDHTAPLPASAAWSTEDLWIKHAPAGNLTGGQ